MPFGGFVCAKKTATYLDIYLILYMVYIVVYLVIYTMYSHCIRGIVDHNISWSVSYVAEILHSFVSSQAKEKWLNKD